jgi:hypothetical protein
MPIHRKAVPDRGGPESYTAGFITEAVIPADRLATAFGVTRDQLADTAGLRRTALAKASRSAGRKTQTRLREMVEILGLVDAGHRLPKNRRSWEGGA